MPEIPIRNLYYLFLYAWDRFPEGRHLEVGLDLSPNLPNLLSRVLISVTRSLLRRGLDRGYNNIVDLPASPRGRFLLGDTIKRNSLVSGRLVCAFDDLSVDVPHNRVLKAALQKLIRSPETNAELVKEMRDLEKRMAGVTPLPLSRELFRPLQLTRNSGHYGLLMQVCEMVLILALPDQRGAGSRFVDILKDEERMSMIFEKFVSNFYRHEQTAFSVSSEVITWEAECLTPEQAGYLPYMVTDVTLRSPSRTIVIDAKFYRQTFVNRHDGRPKIRSNHLYQLQAYIRNMEPRGGSDAAADGVLLYPSVDGKELRLDMLLARHRVRVWTLDLSQPWQHVHNQLLNLIGISTSPIESNMPSSD